MGLIVSVQRCFDKYNMIWIGLCLGLSLWLCLRLWKQRELSLKLAKIKYPHGLIVVTPAEQKYAVASLNPFCTTHGDSTVERISGRLNSLFEKNRLPQFVHRRPYCITLEGDFKLTPTLDSNYSNTQWELEGAVLKLRDGSFKQVQHVLSANLTQHVCDAIKWPQGGNIALTYVQYSLPKSFHESHYWSEVLTILFPS